jgi:hypothetical protein
MIQARSVRGFALVLIIALPLALCALLASMAVDIPYWDEWEWTDLIYSLHRGTLQFSDIWAQHGEHRILVSNLIMLGLDRLGGWDPVREQFVSLGVLVLMQIATIVMLRRSARSTIGIVAAAAASLLLYGLCQSENFSWGFQMEWFICDASAVAVAFILTRPQRRPIDVLLAMVVAIIATYSASQGILTWVVGAVAILLTFRKRTLTLSVWLPAAIIAYLLYTHGLVQMDVGHVNMLAHPLITARYMLTYLGAPLGSWHGANVSALAGLLMIVALATSFAVDVRSSYWARRLVRNSQWYALATFPLLCAAGTAGGRAAYGVDQALASRYTTVSMLGWIAVIGLLASFVARLPQPLARPTMASILALGAVFVTSIVASNVHGLYEWQGTAASLAAARSELIRSDPAALPKIYPVAGRVIMLIGKMREVHDGLFAGP